jgi:hypothetical protein
MKEFSLPFWLLMKVFVFMFGNPIKPVDPCFKHIRDRDCKPARSQDGDVIIARTMLIENSMVSSHVSHWFHNSLQYWHDISH